MQITAIYRATLEGHSLLLFVVEMGIDMLGCSKTCCFPKAILVLHVEGTSVGFEV